MNISQHIAKHLRGVYFGGNWTCSCLKEHLENVTVTETNFHVSEMNTIATLAYHLSYYVTILIEVLEGAPLRGNDKESFEHPDFNTQQEWDAFKAKMWSDAEQLATLFERFSDEDLLNIFSQEKYGTNYRNFHGLIEHAHYHLGQIVLIKKLIRQTSVKT